MIGDAPDFARNLARWQNHIYKTGANRAPWHGVELRARVLRESDTACCLDRTQTSSPVAAGAGKEDADGASTALFRERFKKMVDREIQLLGSADQSQRPIFNNYALARRLNVNRVFLRDSFPGDFRDGHIGHVAQQTGEPTGMVRIEMLNDDKGHSIFWRQMPQQFHRGFESAG